MTNDPLNDGTALEAGWSNEPGVWVDGEKTGDYHEADDEGEALAPRLERFYDDRLFDREPFYYGDPESPDPLVDPPPVNAAEWRWDEYLGRER